jgi:dipeptidase E
VNVVLTSDFPSTLIEGVVDRIQAAGPNPRVAWMCPSTAAGRARFPAAQAAFRSFGVSRLEYCDIDEEPDNAQLEQLDRYDIVYLSGGDPILFRQNLRQRHLAPMLAACVAAGRLVIAASGGAMQLTKNVSLVRLLSDDVDAVVGSHAEYDGLGLVDYELLPHLNRLDAAFLDKVCRYSELVSHDVVALDDGAAIIYSGGDDSRVLGRALRIRRGVTSVIEAPN